MSASDDRIALDALLRVPPRDRRYRQACVGAVDLACRLDALTVVLDQFLGAFVDSGPRDAAESNAFYLLAGLYERHGLSQSAIDVLRRLEEVAPRHRDTPALLARLEAALQAARPERGAILREDVAFRGSTLRAPRAAGAAALSLPPEARDGGVLAGRYQLGKTLCRGRHSFEARDVASGAELTLRFLDAALDSASAAASFRSALEPLRGLAHPNVAALLDLGFQGSTPYLVLEPLRGSDLRQRLTWRPSLGESLDLLGQACAGLAALHVRGLRHGDLRPETLFLTSAGELKLLDAGVAAGLAAAGVALRNRGRVAYLSPEQIAGFDVAAAASDLYSLGVLAYELLCGSLPFDDPDPARVLALHLTQPAPPPRGTAPDLPPDLERLVLQLLEKDPKRRPLSAAACVERLAQLK